MKVYPILLLLILFSISTNAQSGKTLIEGVVLETGTNSPIPFSTISLKDKGVGTISNASGAFRLFIPEKYKADFLFISHIGYQARTIHFDEIKKGAAIYLVENTSTLSEVTVTGLTANSIIDKAIESIPKNYYVEPILSKGFYRLSSKTNQQYIHISEAVFDLYRSKEPSKKDLFKLEKIRSLKDEKASEGLGFGLTVESIFSYDLLSDIKWVEFLSKKGKKKHQFYLEGTYLFNDTEVYVISFDQKDELNKYVGYKGKLYIDVNNFAILQLDYGRSPKGIQNYKYGSAAQRLLMNMLDIHLSLLSDSVSTSYKKVGGKYYLNNVVDYSKMQLKSSREHYNFILDVQNQYVVTELQTKNIKEFSNEDLLKSNKLIENQSSDFDSAFWDNYSIILPDEDFSEIANTLRANNSSDSLKEIIANKVYKSPKDKNIRLDTILTYYNEKGLFNGNALIEYKGDIIFNKSYNNSNTNNIVNTQFRIGSTTKTFTSMLILLLEKEGKLKLTDTIGKYLPEYVHPQITIEQLLTHQSGIPNYLTDEKSLSEVVSKRFTTEELVEQFCSDTLDFDPNTKFKYSNSGYVLLSAIIEKITNKSFGDVLAEKIFNPLEMKDSYFGVSEDSSQLAKGFYYGKEEPGYFRYLAQNMTGAGGITSTTQDLLKWSEAIDTGQLLPKENFEKTWGKYADYNDWLASYGYGWMIDNYFFKTSKRHDLYYHPGTDFGFYTMFLKQPDENITIILLNNTGDFPRFEITDLILEELNR